MGYPLLLTPFQAAELPSAKAATRHSVKNIRGPPRSVVTIMTQHHVSTQLSTLLHLQRICGILY